MHRRRAWFLFIVTAVWLTALTPAVSARVSGLLLDQAGVGDGSCLCAVSPLPTGWVFDRAEGSGLPGTQPVGGFVGWDAFVGGSGWMVTTTDPAGRLSLNERHTMLHWLCRLTV